MNEEQKPGATQQPQADDSPSSAGEKGHTTTGEDLIDALTELGDKFAEVVRVAWNSDQRKQIEADLRAGIVSLADNLEEGFKKASESDEGREIKQRAEGVAESVTESVRRSEVVQNLAEGLMLGLKSLGDSIEELSAEVKSRNEARKSATAAQPVGDAEASASADADQTDESILSDQDDNSQEIPVSEA